jgi:hypothetical protein
VNFLASTLKVVAIVGAIWLGAIFLFVIAWGALMRSVRDAERSLRDDLEKEIPAPEREPSDHKKIIPLRLPESEKRKPAA